MVNLPLGFVNVTELVVRIDGFDSYLRSRLRPPASSLMALDYESGEPGGNRTPNPQIKSLLLCQLSYRPANFRV